MNPDQRLRVAYFVPPSPHFAGIERVVHEIADGLMRQFGDMLDVHVIFSTRYDEDVLVGVPYTLHVLDVDRLRSLPARLRQVARRLDLDVLIVPQVEATVMAWLATLGLRIPMRICHLHGNPHIEEAEGTRRTQVAFTLFRWFVNRTLSAVLAVSPSLRDYAAQSVSPHAPVYFVKNPVRDLHAPAQREPRSGPFRLLNVGRLSRQKGQDILLRALALARPELPPTALTIVGAGDAEFELRGLARDLGVDDIVHFAGYDTDPGARFNAADGFVLSSRWEGFGLVLVEALQFGLPLLAADCLFGPADVITDARVGELVTPDDPAALAEGLKRFVAGSDVRDASDAYRRSVAAGYSSDEATEMHFAVLREIVRAQPHPTRRLRAFLA